jgi:hypothetical protein
LTPVIGPFPQTSQRFAIIFRSDLDSIKQLFSFPRRGF